jgi:hypothetical protein
MRRVLTLLALLAALVPAGCGDSNDRSEDLNSRLGGEGKQDAATLNKYLGRIKTITETDIAIVKAANENDLDTARDKVDDLHTMGTESLAIAEEFKGAKVHTLLTNYSKRISEVADAYDAILDTPESAPQSKFDELAGDLKTAKDRLGVLDRQLQVALKDVLPPDEYKKIQDRMNQLQQQFDEAANGDG